MEKTKRNRKLILLLAAALLLLCGAVWLDLKLTDNEERKARARPRTRGRPW